jgi:predicted O-methyltransferase YrrM
VKFKPVFKYLKYRIFASGHKGYGIHSPFVFELITKAFNKNTIYPELKEVQHWHKSLRKNKVKIDTGNFGAGSHTGRSGYRRISDIVRNSGISPKFGRVLFQLTNHFKFKSILELGTGIGISTAYLRLASRNCEFISIEGSESKSDFAGKEFKKNNWHEVRFVVGEFDSFLKDFSPSSHPFMAFIDGNHSYEPTLRYFNCLLKFCREDSVIVIDDIHWSDEMEKAWFMMRGHEKVSLSLDLYFMGIIFFRKGIHKQDLVINF